METKISFSTDSDGFLSQECPACKGRFKAKFGDGSPEPISWCPYCSHHGRDCWWTPEQAEYIKAVAMGMASDHIGDQLDKMARRINSSSKSGILKMTMKTKRGHRPTPTAPPEPDLDMPIQEFLFCGEHIKHDRSASKLFCVICGKENNIS
jgi:hypothetical protein